MAQNESSVPNLLELLSNDEGVREAREQIGEFFAEGARALTTDLVGAPVDFINMLRAATGAQAFMKDEEGTAVGSSAQIRKLLDQPEPPEFKEESAAALAGNIVGGMLSPGKAASAGAASLAAMAPFLAGIIRKGGLDKLFMTHNVGGDMPMSPEGLMELGDMLVAGKSFSSPSIAINERTLFPFDTTPTLLMNPAQELFDPAVNPGALLYNRDAYVSRSRDLVTPGPMDDLRMTEGATPSSEKAMAILASPKFKSFKEYEEDPRGAGVLASSKSPTTFTYEDVKEKRRRAEIALQKRNPDFWEESKAFKEASLNWTATPQMHQAYREKLLEIAKTNPEVAQYMDSLPLVSSEYAELKLIGEMPLSPEYVSALVFPEASLTNKDRAARRYLQEAARLVGIPAGTPWDLAPQSLRNALENEVDRISNIAGNRDLPLQSSILDKYIGKGWSVNPDDSAANIADDLLAEISYEQALQRDIARFFTRKAVEE